MTHSLSRRRFLARSFAAAGATALSPWAKALGTNNDLRLAVIGFRSRGEQLIEAFRQISGLRIVALCDVDQAVLDAQLEKFKSRGERPTKYTDVRKLLEDKAVDAVAIATPNHWHALMAIWACQAGKDVYVEKPVSHNIWEGQQLLAAARKYNSIVQAGTQNRSDVGLIDAMKFIHEGQLGPIRLARGLCYNRRPSIGKVDGPQVIPSTVNYNLWSGPAPIKSLLRRQFHYDWHWDFTYGNGDIGNQGIHEMDLCRWALQQNALPSRVVSVGGRFGYDDDGQTPNTHIAFFHYQPAPILFEVRGLPARGSGGNIMDKYRGQEVGIVVECEHGYFAGGRFGGAAFDPHGEMIRQFNGDGGKSHQANFVEAVRRRDSKVLRAEIREGQLSTDLCHMANLSWRLGRAASVSDVDAAFANLHLAAEASSRMIQHLEANNVDLNKSPLTLGPVLEWIDSRPRISGDSSNRRLLAHDYRPPFVVPTVV
jgi:predicted dehydrogenase